MGPIFRTPTWADFVSACVGLLKDTLRWLLGAPSGRLVLVLSALFVVLMITGASRRDD